jgi:thioredoxin-dependent peroxiredoxin
MKFIKIVLAILLISFNCKAQTVKDFTLTSVTDKSTFTLSKSKGQFVALHFLLKTECPYCIRHTSEYFDKANTLSDVTHVFIKPDNEQEIKEWANKLKSNNTFPIYQDLDAKLADQFNIPNGYQFHGQVVHYPALILINKKGEEVFRYIGKNNSDRFSFDQLKAKIEEIRKN